MNHIPIIFKLTNITMSGELERQVVEETLRQEQFEKETMDKQDMYKQELDKGVRADNFKEYVKSGGPFGEKKYFQPEPTTFVEDAKAKIEGTTVLQDIKMGVKNALGDPNEKKLC